MPGSIELITGPMYSGKSDLLIRKYQECIGQGLSLSAFKPVREIRDTGIESRTGLRIESISLSSLINFSGHNSGFAVDEAHFFDEPEKEVDFISHAREAGKKVLVSCIDIDYMGEPTEFYQALLAVEPDNLSVLTARCDVIECDDPAIRTGLFRNGSKVRKGESIVVENRQKSDEFYSPLCFEHFSL